jgi:aryl-alcohol dehydrogenase-like predicted oxidoreductase
VAKELGVNLLDTAPAYGSSEERLGLLMQGQRSDWIITSKVGEEFVNGESRFDFSLQAIIKSVERSLQRLKTDYLDIVLIHSDGNDVHLIEDQQVFVVMDVLKKRGLIRAYGMSSKTVSGGMLTVDHADVAMVAFNPAYADEREVIAYAHQKQKGLFVKKGLASGHLSQMGSENPVADAMRFIFAEPGVTSVIVGTINEAHLRENVSFMAR